MSPTVRRLTAGLTLAAALVATACNGATTPPPDPTTTTTIPVETTTTTVPETTTTTTAPPETTTTVPPTTTTTAPPAPVWPAQAEGSTIFEGDSVMWQYVNGGGQTDFPEAEFHAGPGDGLSSCYLSWNPECTTSEAHIADAVARGRADRIYIAHGANDSATTGTVADGLADGWSDADVAAWERILFETIPPTSDVVLLLPWIEAPQPAANVAQVAEARAYMVDVAARRPGTHVVDWEPYFHRPNVAMYDGAHLRNVDGGRTIFDTLGHVTTIEDLTPEAREARRQALADGLALADPPPPAPKPLVVGDSITWQVVMTGRFPAEWRGVTMMGWRMGTPEIQAALEAARTDGTREVVVALGTNDANPTWNGGWDQADVDLWTRYLGGLPADVRIVIVKPWLSEPAAAAHRAEIDETRSFIDAFAAGRPGTAVVDWRTAVDAGPVLGPDGIHLAPVEPGTSIPVTAEAAAARVDVIAAGLAG